ncbi:BRICHOS domain protein [Trichinella nativa]|uniref:Integral membrane protein 2 n=1 Tax=Trichinella nativa TaxID=6335 RepID=A0A1Y3E6E6_9BILA|nr:BRICHOS domain protein [Trichinella nativa]
MSICVSCCGFCSVSLEILQRHHVTDFVELEMLSQLRRTDCCWYEIMTIPTKVEDQSKKAPLESDVVFQTDGTFNAEMPPSANLNHPILVSRYMAWRRARILYLVCLTSLILWLLLTTILGTLLLYRYMERRPMFSASCFTEIADTPYMLAQHVEVDKSGMVEKIDVPSFGMNRPAVVIHDFRKNLTMIKDLVGNKCFLKSLDYQRVAPPKNLIDFISKLRDGYYEPKSSLIRENYRIHLPAITAEQLAALASNSILEACVDLPTYYLVKVTPPSRRMRRSANPDCIHEPYSYFNGRDAVMTHNVILCAQ